jgi:hypothetical protein
MQKINNQARCKLYSRLKYANKKTKEIDSVLVEKLLKKKKCGRALQDNARKSMGMKKGGKVYCKDGCAVRGKTKGKLY